MLMCEYDSRTLDAIELVRNGYRDLVSPFTKHEPHPPRKADLEAWRIVQCVSLVDQLVERVIYSRPVLAIKRLYPTSDAVVGIGFTDQDTKIFHAQVRSDLGPNLKATDIAGWDRSLGAGWVTEAGESIIRSSRIPCAPWENAVRNHVYGLTRPAFVVPNGGIHRVLTRNSPGGMLSGSFMTTTLNTLARLDVARVAGAVRAKAAGDDCLELFTDGYDYIAAYAELGFTIRESLTVAETFDFCSHVYRDASPDRAPLVTWMKLTLRYFLQSKISIEQYCAALFELRHNPELENLRPYFKARYELHNPTSGTEVEQKFENSKQNGQQQEQEQEVQPFLAQASELHVPGSHPESA